MTTTVKQKNSAVKWFAVFLCAMAILTFVSRQIYTSSLSVVSAGAMKNQQISHNIAASGMVECDSVRPVYFPQDILIDSVNVHQGDNVKEGDTLAVLNKKALKSRIHTLRDEIDTSIRTEGLTAGEDAVPVFTEPDMRIMKAAVSQGQKVKKGDTIIEIDRTHLLAYINSLESNKKKDVISRDYMKKALEESKKALEAAKKNGGEAAANAESAAPTVTQEQIDTLNISIEEQQRKIDRYVRVYNSYGRVTAPCDGTVTLLSIKVGDITAENAPIAVISGSAKTSGVISEKQQELKELKAIYNEDGVIRSDVSGAVSTVSVTAGAKPQEGTAAMFIADTENGSMYFSAEVSREQVKHLSIDDSVTVSLRNGKLTSNDAVIRSITAAGEMYRVEARIDNKMFGLSGNKSISYGEMGELKTSSKTAEKYYCINKSAVHGEGGSKYVYVAEESEGFFGAEYHAVKHSISVSDENDTFVGMTAPGLTDDAKIIMTSSKNLTEGARVRLKDTNAAVEESTEAA